MHPAPDALQFEKSYRAGSCLISGNAEIDINSEVEAAVRAWYKPHYPPIFIAPILLKLFQPVGENHLQYNENLCHNWIAELIFFTHRCSPRYVFGDDRNE